MIATIAAGDLAVSSPIRSPRPAAALQQLTGQPIAGALQFGIGHAVLSHHQRDGVAIALGLVAQVVLQQPGHCRDAAA